MTLSKRDTMARAIWLHLEPLVHAGEARTFKKACQAAADDLLGKEGKRDLIFEALCSTLGADWNEMTASARGVYNHAAKQLRDIGATPTEVIQRAHRYEKLHPDWPLTPTSLVKHWPELGAGSSATTRVRDRMQAEEEEYQEEVLVPPPPEALAAMRQLSLGKMEPVPADPG